MKGPWAMALQGLALARELIAAVRELTEELRAHRERVD